jgi:hypothetical protein
MKNLVNTSRLKGARLLSVGGDLVFSDQLSFIRMILWGWMYIFLGL